MELLSDEETTAKELEELVAKYVRALKRDARLWRLEAKGGSDV